jgi:hypothetical protein
MMELKWPVVDLGLWIATPRVLEELGELRAAELLYRHQVGDWGEADGECMRRNADALQDGGRIVSVYGTPAGRVLVVTDADRSETTMLFEDES